MLKITNIYTKNHLKPTADQAQYLATENEYLQVTFNEKDRVKELGAKWDMARKQWFVPKGNSLSPFERWYPYSEQANIKADSFYIIKSQNQCWKCDAISNVYTFALQESETLEDEYGFSKMQTPLICSSVETINKNLHLLVRDIMPNYFYDYSKTVNSYYWMNHCSSCKAVIGDFYMHMEPGGAFYPFDDEPYEYMTKIYCDKPFAAMCAYSPIAYIGKIFAE